MKNIIRQRNELYRDFSINLLSHIIYYYLDKDTLSNDNDIKNHYNWCFNKTCENFKTLVLAGHYDGSLIHRLVKENIYIIQGGGYKLIPKDDGSNNMILKKLDSIAPITNEYNDNNEWVTKGGNNTIQHEAGVIAMARTDNPAITTDQFYFNFNDNLGFNNRYAAFGKCIDEVSLLNLVELGKSETGTIAAGFADFPIPVIEVVAVTIDE